MLITSPGKHVVGPEMSSQDASLTSFDVQFKESSLLPYTAL
jgi:hypothetical protein